MDRCADWLNGAPFLCGHFDAEVDAGNIARIHRSTFHG